MVMVKLARDLKEKFGWRELQQGSKEYNSTELNGYLVVSINQKLWEKIKNMIKLKKKGWDNVILIDGIRRGGKSTLALTIAYLINPDITIKNVVAGLEDSLDAIESVKDEDPLVFDESSLIASGKDTMKKKNSQLLKIVDVVGQKRLTLIFVLPTFFELHKMLAVTHSLFLIHIYTDEKMNRGRFAYFGTKKKRILYNIGKKNFNSYAKPPSNFTGLFYDFHIPFEEQYIKLKRESLRQALNPDEKKDKKIKPQLLSEIKTQLLMQFKQNCPEITDKIIAKGFGISSVEFYRRKKRHMSINS